MREKKMEHKKYYRGKRWKIGKVLIQELEHTNEVLTAYENPPKSKPDDLGFAVDRVWAMPNRWTFTIKPIKKLLEKYCVGKDGKWADPFCGENSAANITNDINKTIKATYNTEALEFLKNLVDNYFTGILYNPPYSITQARMYGKKEFASMKYWADCKNEIARAIKPGGYAICFGWNSNGLGKNRGFRLKELLLVPHGGSKNDTIITVEEKLENYENLLKMKEVKLRPVKRNKKGGLDKRVYEKLK